MIANRSVPSAPIIPVLAYADVAEATDWLCNAFGFRVRLRIAEHRAQLLFGDGAVIVTDLGGAQGEPRVGFQGPRSAAHTHSVHARVEDADGHHERAAKHGARILHPPTDYPYGERQYSGEDLGGHRWTFSQSVADVDPTSWGATINIA